MNLRIVLLPCSFEPAFADGITDSISEAGASIELKRNEVLGQNFKQLITNRYYQRDVVPLENPPIDRF